jgi:hypothetical protein
MTGPGRSILGYFAAAAASALLVASLSFAINFLVDPLWYRGGNSLTGVNFAFNERLSKLNHLLPRIKDHDCLIMGSSRATIFPEKLIHDHRCFNLAFSGGRVSEFVLYAKYLRARGFDPKLLIVGVDGFDFLGPPRIPNVPDFVRTGEDPPRIFLPYLSLDVLWFSIRTLLKLPPNHRYYDRDLTGHVWPRTHPYRPPSLSDPFPDPSDVHSERADLYLQLRQVFPGARAIGYIPPISAWTVVQFDRTGHLDEVIAAMHRAASAFDDFFDFALPSEITKATSTTYDGSHYSEAVNAKIAATLQDEKATHEVDWLHEEIAAIAARYHARVDEFVRKIEQGRK